MRAGLFFKRNVGPRQNERRIEVDDRNKVDEVREELSKILGEPYEEAYSIKVSVADKPVVGEIPGVVTKTESYTGSHMGAGEQKIFYLVNEFENLSKQSLILLEEPEVALHPAVHRRFALYLIELAWRKGHQIILTTHSPAIFRTFPPQARIGLIRKEGKIQVENDPLIVEGELSGSVYTNKDIIIVEDEEAKVFLQVILRKFNNYLYEQVSIVTLGNSDDVRKTIQALKVAGHVS